MVPGSADLKAGLKGVLSLPLPSSRCRSARSSSTAADLSINPGVAQLIEDLPINRARREAHQLQISAGHYRAPMQRQSDAYALRFA